MIIDDIDYPAELLDMLKPNKKLRIFYNEDNMNNRLMHIRAIVDNQLVVTRYWTGRSWQYDIDSFYWFLVLHRSGYLRKA